LFYVHDLGLKDIELEIKNSTLHMMLTPRFLPQRIPPKTYYNFQELQFSIDVG
jgi:hypothetical protein